jgi:hypothetical protein
MSLIINVPLCIFAFFLIERKFSIKTLIFCLVYSLVYLGLQQLDFSKFQYNAQGIDTVYPVIIAGLLSGLVYGLLFKINACTGGTDIVARFLSKKKPFLNFFWVMFSINAVVAISSCFVYAENGVLKYIASNPKYSPAQTFYDVLNDLRMQQNLDVYVTGSNSKMLSKDIVTHFRDRGCEIKVFPLSFKEYYAHAGLEKADAFEMYLTYGGMPLAVLENDEISKQQYLADLHKNVYIKDIVERYKLRDDVIIDSLTDVIYSSVGSLTNPHKLANTLGSVLGRSTSDRTIKIYLDYLVDSYLLASADRYDVKGKRYFNTIKKYYACDLGLRNARINFRQQERSHLMENMIYNELLRRGYRVDVGVVEVDEW